MRVFHPSLRAIDMQTILLLLTKTHAFCGRKHPKFWATLLPDGCQNHFRAVVKLACIGQVNSPTACNGKYLCLYIMGKFPSVGHVKRL